MTLGTVEKVSQLVGADSHVRPNATYLHDLYIYPSNHGLHKFDG